MYSIYNSLIGFGAHPHRNTEICTYVVDGSLTHQDNMGTKETLGRGAIQFMTAGSGVVHSEHNLDKTTPLRFIQMWITSRRSNLPPNYGSSVGDYESRHNQWHHMVSDVDNNVCTDIPIQINQDVNIYVTELDVDKSLIFNLLPKRQAYLLCIEGDITLTNTDTTTTLEKHDAAELYKLYDTEELPIEVKATSNAHVLVVEMAYTGKGRSDV